MQQELSRLRTLADAIASLHTQQGIDKPAELRKLTNNGLLALLCLKSASKSSCFEVEGLKDQTAQAKLELETADTTLQNLLYEKSYYEKEIRSCRNFASKVTDEAVALMPVDQFLASLGDTAEARAQRLQLLADDHELMKARLTHEHEERVKLVKQLEELAKMKHHVLHMVGQKQQQLRGLQTNLKALETSAKSLYASLAPVVPLRQGFSRAADLLPTPLYILYAQAVAARDSLGVACAANIRGSTEEADSFAQQVAAEQQQQLLQQAQQAEPGAAAVLRQLQQQQQPKPSPTRKPAKAEDVYQEHPLTVELQIYQEAQLPPSTSASNNSFAKAPTILLSVVFAYLPRLKVVTAQCVPMDGVPDNASNNALLATLFPGDDGSGAAVEQLSQLQGGTFQFRSSRAARPYRWCQHLCGVDFAPTLPMLAVQLPSSGAQTDAVLAGLERYRREQRVQTVVARLRAAKLGLNQEPGAVEGAEERQAAEGEELLGEGELVGGEGEEEDVAMAT